MVIFYAKENVYTERAYLHLDRHIPTWYNSSIEEVILLYVYTKKSPWRIALATIQAKWSRGHKYWYIVESRRVNGKPRPIVLEYLGKPDTLLKRLRGLNKSNRIKSYSHGTVAVMLDIAFKLDLPATINKHIKSAHPYMADKPVRNNLTAGITLLLAAIGRTCMPTSKRGWWNWAKTTSLQYLLKCSLCKIDSQHFWDMMDSLPAEAIPKIEKELLEKVLENYDINTDSLFYDTTNFFTFIATTNEKCTIAKRAKNKQKRHDLRQVGLAMVVNSPDLIPLLHHTYQGNMADASVFKEVIGTIKKRMQDLGLDLQHHTIVFDRGNNSKKNLAVVQQLELHYVGALTPYHHQQLVNDAIAGFEPLDIGNGEISVYRDERVIWGESRTVVVFISDKLKAGQLRGIYQALKKKVERLRKIQAGLDKPCGRKKKLDKVKLEEQIDDLLRGQFVSGLIGYELKERADGKLDLTFWRNDDQLEAVEEALGLRIIMTDRHEWETGSIIKAYHGQSHVEGAFKNLKNPHHLAVRPHFHWTDQKLRAHHFICVMGYMLSTIVWREARRKTGFGGTLGSLIDRLSNVRLALQLEISGEKGRPKSAYMLEDMSDEERGLMEALGIEDFHAQRHRLGGVGVYNQ